MSNKKNHRFSGPFTLFRRRGTLGAGLVFCTLSLAAGACLVDSRCYEDLDCPQGRSCEAASGRCLPWECSSDEDCGEGLVCDETHRCRESEQLVCPEGMVSIKGLFCIDVYEASRPDASMSSSGTDGSLAVSRPNVIPWQVSSNAVAQAACAAAGKDLCTAEEWTLACQGPSQQTYGYGDAYDPAICNGIDTFCDCDTGPCSEHEPCPYPHCFHDCRAYTAFHLLPTGHLAGCTNAYGVFDMNGNLWEHVKNGDNTLIRGGAFNCSDSERLHRCDYIPGNWTPSARGFRCCWHAEAGR